jgi:hypothetical protein
MYRTSILVFVVLASTSCVTTHQGYIIKSDTAQRGTVAFHDKYFRRGTIDAVLTDGEKCQGQFNTIPDHVTRNWDDPSDIEREDTQIGVAVFQCTDSHVMRCNFSRSDAGAGSGQCLDNQGVKYSLYF